MTTDNTHHYGNLIAMGFVAAVNILPEHKRFGCGTQVTHVYQVCPPTVFEYESWYSVSSSNVHGPVPYPCPCPCVVRTVKTHRLSISCSVNDQLYSRLKGLFLFHRNCPVEVEE